MDQQLKQLMKELGEAINESLADSEQIAEVVSKIKDSGYDIFLVLEATIGVSKPGEKSGRQDSSLVTTLTTNPEFKISDQDLKFLEVATDQDRERRGLAVINFRPPIFQQIQAGLRLPRDPKALIITILQSSSSRQRVRLCSWLKADS